MRVVREGECELTIRVVENLKRGYYWVHEHNAWEVMFFDGSAFFKTCNRERYYPDELDRETWMYSKPIDTPFNEPWR